MMILASLLEIAGIGMITVFASIVAHPGTILERDTLGSFLEAVGIATNDDLLIYGAIFLILIFLIKNSYIVFFKYIKARFLWNRFSIIGNNLFKQYMKGPYEFHMHRNSSELLRNITQETQYLITNVLSPGLIIAMESILILSIFIFLLIIQPVITIGVAVIIGGGAGLFLKFIKNRTKKYGIIAQEERKMMIHSVNEGLGGLKDARVLGREDWFAERFKGRITNYSRSRIFKEFTSKITKPVLETIGVTGILLIALLLFMQSKTIESVIPLLTLFGATTIRLMPSIRELVTNFTSIRYYSYTIHPIYDDMVKLKRDIKISRSNNFEIVKPLRLKHSVSFQHVSYRYPGSSCDVISDLTLEIPRGSSVGFMGISGAGKTTLADLLLGLLKPQQGQILVDGADIHDNISGWYKSIGYISQSTFLADTTVKQNIAFGLRDDDIDEEKLYNAVRAAHLDSFINGLRDGINTVVGERGIRLSGGQRQRVGIARAMYNDPEVLLMDEATSALDNLTEQYVMEAINSLKGERTIIMIAHRLTTVKNCDVLYFMDRGGGVQRGTYSDLIESSQKFREMVIEK